MPISLKFGDGNPGSIPLLQFAHKTNQNTVGLTDCWRYAQSKGTTRLMSTRTFRGAAAAALSIGLATTGLTSAQAATDPTPGTLTRAPSSTLATLQADALRVLGQSPNKSSLAATPPGIIQTTSVCPTGQSPDALHSYESFEAGLPFPDLSDGFTVATGTGAPDGSHWASSTLPADPAVPPAIHVVDSNYDLAPRPARSTCHSAIGARSPTASPLPGSTAPSGSLRRTPTGQQLPWTSLRKRPPPAMEPSMCLLVIWPTQPPRDPSTSMTWPSTPARPTPLLRRPPLLRLRRTRGSAVTGPVRAPLT